MPIVVRTRTLAGYEQRLERLIENVDADVKHSRLDDYVVGAITEAVCIRVAGYVEVFFRETLGAFAAETSSMPASRYVCGELGFVTNLNAKKAVDLVRSFSPNLAEELERKPEMEQEGEWRTALDSIYNLRNNLAHGRGGCQSFTSISSYFLRLKKMAAFLLPKIAAMSG